MLIKVYDSLSLFDAEFEYFKIHTTQSKHTILPVKRAFPSQYKKQMTSRVVAHAYLGACFKSSTLHGLVLENLCAVLLKNFLVLQLSISKSLS